MAASNAHGFTLHIAALHIAALHSAHIQRIAGTFFQDSLRLPRLQ